MYKNNAYFYLTSCLCGSSSLPGELLLLPNDLFKSVVHLRDGLELCEANETSVGDLIHTALFTLDDCKKQRQVQHRLVHCTEILFDSVEKASVNNEATAPEPTLY